jgi:hypothetical protein
MGRIYLAEDTELGRRVAVKILDDRFASDSQLRDRFKREALTAARLSSHPHVVTIFDVGEWEGRPFIVMEYLPGGTLAERTRRAAGRAGRGNRLAPAGRAGPRPRARARDRSPGREAGEPPLSTSGTASRSPTSASRGSPTRVRAA